MSNAESFIDVPIMFRENIKRTNPPFCYQKVVFAPRSKGRIRPPSEFILDVRFQIRGLYPNTHTATAVEIARRPRLLQSSIIDEDPKRGIR
jgi:hypothetical protein